MTDTETVIVSVYLVPFITMWNIRRERTALLITNSSCTWDTQRITKRYTINPLINISVRDRRMRMFDFQLKK